MMVTKRRDRRIRRQTGRSLESLDDRCLLSAAALGATAEALVHDQPADHSHLNNHVNQREVIGDRLPASLPTNVSAPLRSLYRQYADEVRDSRSAAGQPGDALVSVRSFKVAVRIKVAFPPALNAYVRVLRADGMQVVRTVPNFGVVEGTLPVAELPAVAQISAHVWPTTLGDKP